MDYSVTQSNDFQLNSVSQNDYSDATLKFINDMLMEEDENTPSMLHDLLATERSLYDALNNSEETDHREKKNRLREEDGEEHRSNKQIARNLDESEFLEMFDSVLLSSETSSNRHSQTERRAVKGGVVFTKQFADLRSLLIKCTKAVVNMDTVTAIPLLIKIRHFSSPQGAILERVAHYFANALEARLEGTKSPDTIFDLDGTSTVEVLKSYKTVTASCPFSKMSHLLANKAIEKIANKATSVHIIDFGILYGFQWPSLIQALSQRKGGPPRLRVTGIEFPQKGPRPAQRVEETGRRLGKYCDRFGVPFEYNGIAQKWETVSIEDLKMDKDELVVVNSMYRHHVLLDERMIGDDMIRTRDAVLNLIKNINPHMLVHGIANGHYNVPFFTTKFREALFHFCNQLDMFESTIPVGERERLLSEEQIFGAEAIFIVGCQGTDKIVKRPESYKKWQVRMRKLGFRQLPLDQQVVEYVRIKTKTEYHKGFSVEQDWKWMLQGWKGHFIHAISCWQPTWSTSALRPS